MTEMTLDEFVEILRWETEEIFGVPTNDWFYSGVEFRETGPSLLYFPQTGEIKICLSNKVKNDFPQLLFQLAHEVCHLLHPSKEFPSLVTNKTTVINEGLSTYYSACKMNDYLKMGEATIESLKNHNTNYYQAFVLVNDLIAKDPNAIKKLRTQKPRIDKLEPSDFDALDFELATEIKGKLISPF